MKYRQIGSSDLTVSEISLGSWLTYGGGVGDDQARACVDAAFDAGINFVDTANVYALGAAEEFLGDALQDRPRESYVLATKLYFPMDDTGENQGLSGEQVHKQIEESLRRLRTEYVDLYQCHRYDTRDAARGDHGGAHRRRARRQGALHRLQRMDGAPDPGLARPLT